MTPETAQHPAPPDADPHAPSPGLRDAPAAGPAPVAPVVVPRWVQLVMLPLSILALYALASAAGGVILIFLVAAVVALVLNPIVRRIDAVGAPHGLSVFGAYLTCLAILAAVVLLLANPVSTQVDNFSRDVPHLVRSANRSLANFQRYLDRHHIKVQVQRQGQTALETLQRNVLRRSGDVVSFSRNLLGKVVAGAFALVLVLVVSVYMLLYSASIGRLVRRVMPPGDGTPEDDFPSRVQQAVKQYVRGQLLFSLIMGTTAGLALWILGLVGVFPDGQRYAVFFGVFFGLCELIPYVGPVLGALPPVLVALFQDPLTALWVALLFLALQQLEGHVVAPQLFGRSLRINPLLIIFALLLGGELYGVVGAFIALPLAAVVRETVMYLRRHLVFEPWGRSAAVGLGGGAAAALPAPAKERACPSCEAPAAVGDAFCRNCGAAL